jgi:hypothetical protein
MNIKKFLGLGTSLLSLSIPVGIVLDSVLSTAVAQNRGIVEDVYRNAGGRHGALGECNRRPQRRNFHRETIYIWSCRGGVIVQDADDQNRTYTILGSTWGEFRRQGGFRNVGIPIGNEEPQGNQILFQRFQKGSLNSRYNNNDWGYDDDRYSDRDNLTCIVFDGRYNRTIFMHGECRYEWNQDQDRYPRRRNRNY